MVRFTATIEKFGKQGEKTGWSYILVSEKILNILNPGVKKSFRVKGTVDHHSIRQAALLPMGDGTFILALNGTIRRAIKKEKGAKVEVQMEVDETPLGLSADFVECLNDEPAALAFFNTLPAGHRNYFSRWIESARTEPTKAKRIAQAVNALAKHWGYSEMIQAAKEQSKL